MQKSSRIEFRFTFRNEDPNATEPEINQRLQDAMADALKDAKSLSKIDGSVELEGGFAGLGESAVILAVLHAAKAGATAFSLGAISAAGKKFFDDFLAPKLRKRNLLPGALQSIAPKKRVFPARQKKKKKTGK